MRQKYLIFHTQAKKSEILFEILSRENQQEKVFKKIFCEIASFSSQ